MRSDVSAWNAAVDAVAVELARLVGPVSKVMLAVRSVRMPVNNYDFDNQGLALTEGFEGLRLTAYQDQGGVWTIGYGHTGKDVTPGMTITVDQAVALLHADVAAAVACVNHAVTVPITQDEFDALVDFTFNCGSGAFVSSTLLRELNAGNMLAAAEQFLRWVNVAGKPNAGLLRRRQAEEALFVRSA